MANVIIDTQPEEQGDCSRPAGSDDEQNISEQVKSIQDVLDSMAEENLDVLSKEELEEIILEMERAADEKAPPAMPFPDVP